MIYVLEGPDGTGKSTLAREIAGEFKGSILHSSFDKSWNVEDYHRDIMRAATIVNKWRDVVVDRWALSEVVYGTIFRNGPSYDAMSLMLEAQEEVPITWILCRNDQAAENHARNAERRFEMFDDMTQVAEMFDEIVEADIDREWLIYDFGKISIDGFIKILKEKS